MGKYGQHRLVNILVSPLRRYGVRLYPYIFGMDVDRTRWPRDLMLGGWEVSLALSPSLTIREFGGH